MSCHLCVKVPMSGLEAHPITQDSHTVASGAGNQDSGAAVFSGFKAHF